MEVFLGFIAAFGFNFPPSGWALCAGQLLPISQYTALFSLLGTTYGGDGRITFGLPDLRGRIAVGQGAGPGLSPYSIGQTGGIENITLLNNQMPAHNHSMMGSSDGQSVSGAAGNSLGSAVRGSTTGTIYAPGVSSQVAMGSPTSMAGGNQPHANMQPYLTINYCIALQGIYPSRD